MNEIFVSQIVAISCTCTHTVVGGLVVLTQTIFVQGLRILGQKMSDPWGDDKIDLSVIHFCVFNWRMSNRVLKSSFPPREASLEEEENLAKDCMGLGDAWKTTAEDDEVESGRVRPTPSEQPSQTRMQITADADTWKVEDQD